MEILSLQFLAALGSIIILDLVLAGDNAVVIAMASRRLPDALRRRVIWIGTAGAVIIRMVMTFAAVWLLTVPYLQAIGGLVLLPIAVKLLVPSGEGEHIKASDSFWGAVRTIIVADAAMGIDNVLAIAGASHGSFLLVCAGLVISVPIVVGGSQLIGRAMDRWPALIYIGAGILAWTAGSMIMHDQSVGGLVAGILGGWSVYGIPAMFTAAVCAIGCGKRQTA